jgi:type I restriction enzyme, S subunit
MSNKVEETKMKLAGKCTLKPRLRFPEFQDAGEWKEKLLHQVAKPVSDKASGKEKNNILTLSGEQGLVLQSEYFGKKIAGENVERYIRIVRNDFVYNDRTTKLSTYGSIKRLSNHESGIVSPIYKCFRFNDAENPLFWEWYFESGSHEGQLHGLVNEGARTGRFNISIEKFLSTLVWHPSPAEQHKIAGCLSSINALITAEVQKLDTLKAHKKGLMQQLFPTEGETLPKLRFPEFRDAAGWSKTTLKDVLTEHRLKSDGKSEVHSVSVHKGVINQKEHLGRSFAAADTSNYNLAKPYDVIYTKSPTGDFPYGVIKHNHNNYNVIVSPLYGVFSPINKYVGYIFDAYFESPIRTRNYLAPITQKGAKNTIQISNETFLSGGIYLPLEEAEQHKIAGCLSSIDELITAEVQKLDALKAHKKGLMQWLFPAFDEVQG